MRELAMQRRCACGGTPGPDGECAACKTKRLARTQSLVADTLRSPGRTLGHLESSLGDDFGNVRVQSESRAAEEHGLRAGLLRPSPPPMLAAPGSIRETHVLPAPLDIRLEPPGLVTPGEPHPRLLDGGGEIERVFPRAVMRP